MPFFQFEMTAYRNRDHDQWFAVYESDGVTGVAFSASDDVLCKIWHVENQVDLDLSTVANSNGSVVVVDQLTAPAEVTLKLMRADMAILRRDRYDIEMILVDSGDSNRYKPFCRGTLYIEDSPA